jgi:hypothetical protein
MLNNKNSVLEYAWSAVFLTLQLSISLSENAAIKYTNRQNIGKFTRNNAGKILSGKFTQ